MSNPNIFKYSTSELSQDAIICYILEWAKVERKTINIDLHEIAVSFLDSIFSKFTNIEKPRSYHEIDIKKQYKNIDILCVVNNKYSIIIEDKTNTKNHSGQLKRYFDTVKKDFNETEVMRVYFKTGDQSNYDDVIKNEYEVYSRKDFLDVLNSKLVKNDIVENYTEYLQQIEDEVNSYKILPSNEWGWNSWKGFFIELRKQLNSGNWDYVSNPSGGFLGFWWNWIEAEKYNIYLQIDHSINKITIKLYTKTDAKIEKAIVDEWKQHIKHNYGGIIINKPKVVRAGKSVTIGIVENDFIVSDSEGVVNIDKTIEFIKKIEDIQLDKLNSVGFGSQV